MTTRRVRPPVDIWNLRGVDRVRHSGQSVLIERECCAHNVINMLRTALLSEAKCYY